MAVRSGPGPSHDVAARTVRAAFKDVQLALRRLRAREARAGSTTLARFSVLKALADHGDLPASRLAAAAEVSPPTVTRMLDDLERAGLVERVRDDADRRVVRVRLTGSGRVEHGAFEERLAVAWQAALGDLAPADLAAAARVLVRIRSVYDGL